MVRILRRPSGSPAARRPAARPPRPPRRRLAGPRVVSRARLAGALLTIGSGVAMAWLLGSPAFIVEDDTVRISGLGYTAPSAVRDVIGLPVGHSANVFRLRTTEMRRALAALPAVAEADVRVTLPDTLEVDIVERTPVVAVNRPAGEYLVDGEGAVLDRRDGAAPSMALPVIIDQRDEFAVDMDVGGRLDETEAAAMLQLAAIDPATIGSSASELKLAVNDEDGYVMTAEPFGWRAIFGHFTPTLRPPSIIARQVQCLRSLLAAGEESIDTVYLVPLDDRCGTYLPDATPRASPSPSPSG